METLEAYQGELLAGVDEAGRGPLAGPVVAAAVILDRTRPIEGLDDSKKLSEKKREMLYEKIKERALAYAIGRAEVDEIDTINILQATLLAMQRAVDALSITPKFVVVDGNQYPVLKVPCKAVIGGDSLVEEISAASILAKVVRDREMIALDRRFPHYGFARHKGYPTKIHLEALKNHGPTVVHRKSFSPVRVLLSCTEA